jgi:crotonobetainyl-CoA:carnitine CoA-transferase CaiB-like acyl-CoA transferase
VTGPRVLDLSTGLAGAYTCLLLSYAGADVARAEPAGGDPLRRWRQGPLEAAGDGALFEYLRQGQTAFTLTSGDFDPLGADIIITSPEPSQAKALQELVAAHPGLIAVSFTPYGLEGPYADRPASDLTVEADSGGLAIRGRSDRAPYQMGGRTCEWLAGAYAAAATLALWHGRRRGGPGGLIDLSQAELLHAAASNYMDVFHAVAHAEDGGADADPTGPPRSLETPSIEKSSDGWVGFNTNSPHQIAGFLNMLGRPDLVASGEYGTAAKRIGRIEEWQALVTAWTSVHSSAEIIALAEANGVPVAPVSDSRSVAELDQIVARRTLVTAPSGRFQMPGQPWRINGERGPKLGPAPLISADQQPAWRSTTTAPAVTGSGRPLEGLRVLDLTTWWAGPSATAFLAALRADVIHVEAPARMDGARMVGAAFLPRPQFWELSNFFLTVNVNKRGLALDLTTERGREIFLQLVEQCDVVVENATPRVMDKLKLGWDVIHAANPRAILTRMPAYGLDGPWRERPGFAQNIEQASGLAWLTGEPSDQPRIQRGPADPNGGMHAAFATLVALEQRERTGEGSLVESSLFDAALAIDAELIIEWSAYQNPLLRIGNRSVTSAPQGVYGCQGADSWLAITVATDEQWQALVGLLERDDLKDAAFASEAGRRAQHDLLDAALSEWTAGRDVEEAVTTLLDAGIPAAHARDPRLAARNPQFRDRGYHQLVEHPVAGTVPIPTLPYRITGEPWIRTPAPTLGQHNAEILTGLLGLTQEDLDQLTADGVIATSPKF